MHIHTYTQYIHICTITHKHIDTGIHIQVHTITHTITCMHTHTPIKITNKVKVTINTRMYTLQDGLLRPNFGAMTVTWSRITTL